MKNILILLTMAVSSFTETYTDNFNRAALGGDWTTINSASGVTILSSDTLAPSTLSARCGAYYNVADSADSQAVTATIYYGAEVSNCWVAARIKSGVQTCYCFGFAGSSGSINIRKYINGTSTTLSTLSMPYPSGSIFTIVVHHDTIVGIVNGTPVDTVTDGDISGEGYGGVFGYFAAGQVGYYDNFTLTDNNMSSVCDTADAVVYDSTKSALQYKVFARCDNTDSLGLIYALDTLTPLDTVWHIDGYADGDSAVDSIINLNPSTKYWYAAIDSINQSIWKFAYTMNDTDSVVISNPPVITAQPENDTVDENSTATFSITATGATDYVVYRNSDSVGNSNSYSFTAALDDDGDSIWWKLSNDSGDVYSDTAFLTVNDTIISSNTITITDQPDSQTVQSGTPVTFSVTATGCENLHYQWTINDSGYTIDNDSISVIPNTLHDSSKVTCKVWSDECDTVVSDTGRLYVTPVYMIPVDTLKVGSFDYINSSGTMYPTTGWTIRIVRGITDTVNTTITAQNEYGFTGVIFDDPLVVRSALYEVLYINGSMTIKKYMRISGSSNGKSIFYFFK